MRSAALSILLLGVSCGAGGPPDGGVTDAGCSSSWDGGLDTSQSGLAALASTEAWCGWRDDGAHGSTGPHGGKVRTFLNPALYTSLKANGPTHPAGSIAIKHLLDSSGATLTGMAINVKDTDGGWVFYETLKWPPSEGFYQRGNSGFCGSCHQGGLDFVSTPANTFP